MSTHMTMADQAVSGLDVEIDSGIVRVRDGHDTWLCRESAWDAAIAGLAARDAIVAEACADAYSALCAAVRSPVASINGTSRGDIVTLVREAYDVELIDADDARAYGVEVAT